ncbi:MAG: hypothetical protein P8N02_15980 [Actinomycetota bacterium]|jgi:hypothetical protein|nr:hypothetical protein [Actinomycetota bacterium]
MNQSIDVVSLLVGVVFVAAGVWLLGDALGSGLPLTLLLPVVGIVAVVMSLVSINRSTPPG